MPHSSVSGKVRRDGLDEYVCVFLGSRIGYRVFDLENAKIKETRSVRLDEREVGGIYDMQEVKPERVIQVMKDGDEVKVQHQVDRQPVLDDPMEAVEEPVADVEMDDMDHAPSIDAQRLMSSESPVQNRLKLMEYHHSTEVQHEDRLVFQPEVERTRARREPVLMIRNGSDDEDSAEGSEGPPTPKRARIDEDGRIAEAVLAYAVSIDDDTDIPTTYAQAIASDDPMKWRKKKIERGH